MAVAGQPPLLWSAVLWRIGPLLRLARLSGTLLQQGTVGHTHSGCGSLKRVTS